MRSSRFAATRRAGGLLLFLLTVLLPLLSPSGPAHAAGNPVIFSVFGDMPYRESEIADLEEHVANLNLYSPSAFLVHVGDIMSGSETCQEIRYQTVSDILKTAEIPVFVLPGDNEWLNCSNPSQGWAWWEKYFLGIEESFCGVWPVDAQPTHPENFSFVREGVLFLGLNYVSGSPSSVTQADADWVNAQFATYGATARAAVLLAQKEPGGVLFDAVKARGRAFGKPVLYMHGNGHAWEVDSAFFGEANMLRVQVDRGTLSNPPVQVTVTSSDQFQFNRNPWPAGTSEVARPACGDPPALSIDDLFVTEGQNAVFTVSLANATGSAVSVNYSTQDDTARAGQDYTAKSGSLSFSGTTTQRQITVSVTQDTTAETAESFFVNLAGASGAAIAKGQGAAVILDDESPPSSGGGPVLQGVVSGGSTSSAIVSTSAAVAAASGDLYLAAVAFKSNVAVSSISGLGLSWTPVRTQCGGRGQTGVAVFRAQGTPTGSGVVTANLAEAASAAVITVARYSGVSSSASIGTLRSANTNGLSGSCSGGIDTDAYAFDTSTSAANSLVFVATAMRSKDHTPGAGFTETAETYAGSGGSTAGASLAERLVGSAGALSVSGSFSGTTDWAVVAAEIVSGAPTASPVHLSVTTSPGGAVVLDPPGGSYPPGTTVKLTAVPDPGFAFTGWSGALSGSANPATLVMDADKTVSASFSATASQYTVTIQPTTGGSVSLSPSGGTYAAGTLVTVTAVPAAGYRFGSWTGALSGSTNPTTLLVDGNKTLSATFVRQFTVSVSSTGGGSVALSPAGGVYDAGTLVTLTAVPDAGASFLGWSGAVTGLQNPTTLLVDANKSVTASFSATYTLSVSTKGKGSVVLDPPGGSYAAGTVVTLTAEPGSGFRFLGWSGDLGGLANPTTLVMGGNRSVTATFRK